MTDTSTASENSFTTRDSTSPQEHWSAVFAMTLCVFTLIASEFMPVSLLTPMAADLGVSEGMVGQGIAISGALAVLTSLCISSLVGTMNRKVFLMGMTGLMVVSGTIIAAAPNYTIYMVGRAFIGIAIGGFWSMSAATAIRLVFTASVPKALAIFNGGNALAMVIAAPLSSYLGGLIGWRGAFYCVVPIAIIAFIWQWISLPSMTSDQAAKGFSNTLTTLKNSLFSLGLLAAGLFFMGQFALFTYLRPFLETVTLVDTSTLSLMLLIIGVSGFLGTTLVNRMIRISLYRTLWVIPAIMAVIAVTLTTLGHQLTLVGIALAVWGFVATAAPVAWWAWLAKTLPNDAETGGGLMVAMVQLSIALGSTIGGVLFDTQGYTSTFLFSASLLILSVGLTYLCARYDKADR